MELKKRGRPRSRDTIFLECPICHANKIRSLEEYKLKGSINWKPNVNLKSKPSISLGLNSKSKIKEEQPSEQLQPHNKKSLIIDLMN